MDSKVQHTFQSLELVPMTPKCIHRYGVKIEGARGMLGYVIPTAVREPYDIFMTDFKDTASETEDIARLFKSGLHVFSIAARIIQRRLRNENNLSSISPQRKVRTITTQPKSAMRKKSKRVQEELSRTSVQDENKSTDSGDKEKRMHEENRRAFNYLNIMKDQEEDEEEETSSQSTKESRDLPSSPSHSRDGEEDSASDDDSNACDEEDEEDEELQLRNAYCDSCSLFAIKTEKYIALIIVSFNDAITNDDIERDYSQMLQAIEKERREKGRMRNKRIEETIEEREYETFSEEIMAKLSDSYINFYNKINYRRKAYSKEAKKVEEPYVRYTGPPKGTPVTMFTPKCTYGALVSISPNDVHELLGFEDSPQESLDFIQRIFSGATPQSFSIHSKYPVYELSIDDIAFDIEKKVVPWIPDHIMTFLNNNCKSQIMGMTVLNNQTLEYMSYRTESIPGEIHVKAPIDILKECHDELDRKRGKVAKTLDERRQYRDRLCYVLFSRIGMYNPRAIRKSAEYLYKRISATNRYEFNMTGTVLTSMNAYKEENFDEFYKVRGESVIDLKGGEHYEPYSAFLRHMATLAATEYKISGPNSETYHLVYSSFLDRHDIESANKINILLYGTGQSGKSYSATCAIECLMTDTIEVETAQGSEQSDSTGDIEHSVGGVYRDEAMKAMVEDENRMSGKGEFNQLNTFKAATSYGEIVRKLCEMVKDPRTGRSSRRSVYVRTKCNHQYVACTNIKRNRGQAADTRLFTKSVPKEKSQEVINKMAGLQIAKNDEASNKRKKDALELPRAVDALVFLIQMSIYTGDICSVSNELAHMIMVDLLTSAYSIGIKKAGNPRDYSRNIRHVTVSTIVSAIVRMYFVEDASKNNFYGQFPNIMKHWDRIEEELFSDIPEIFSSFVTMWEQYVDPLPSSVKRHLATSYTPISQKQWESLKKERIEERKRLREKESAEKIESALSTLESGKEGCKEENLKEQKRTNTGSGPDSVDGALVLENESAAVKQGGDVVEEEMFPEEIPEPEYEDLFCEERPHGGTGEKQEEMEEEESMFCETYCSSFTEPRSSKKRKREEDEETGSRDEEDQEMRSRDEEDQSTEKQHYNPRTSSLHEIPTAIMEELKNEKMFMKEYMAPTGEVKDPWIDHRFEELDKIILWVINSTSSSSFLVAPGCSEASSKMIHAQARRRDAFRKKKNNTENRGDNILESAVKKVQERTFYAQGEASSSQALKRKKLQESLSLSSREEEEEEMHSFSTKRKPAFENRIQEEEDVFSSATENEDPWNLYTDVNIICSPAHAKRYEAIVSDTMDRMDMLPAYCHARDVLDTLQKEFETFDIYFDPISALYFEEHIVPIYRMITTGKIYNKSFKKQEDRIRKLKEVFTYKKNVKRLPFMTRRSEKNNNEFEVCIAWNSVIEDEETRLVDMLSSVISFKGLRERNILLPMTSKSFKTDEDTRFYDLKINPGKIPVFNWKNPNYIKNSERRVIEATLEISRQRIAKKRKLEEELDRDKWIIMGRKEEDEMRMLKENREECELETLMKKMKLDSQENFEPFYERMKLESSERDGEIIEDGMSSDLNGYGEECAEDYLYLWKYVKRGGSVEYIGNKSNIIIEKDPGEWIRDLRAKRVNDRRMLTSKQLEVIKRSINSSEMELGFRRDSKAFSNLFE